MIFVDFFLLIVPAQAEFLSDDKDFTIAVHAIGMGNMRKLPWSFV